MASLGLNNIRLNVEAGILLENFADMVCPDEDLRSLYGDPQRCYAEKMEDSGLLINIVINGKIRSCQIQSGDWEPIVQSTSTILDSKITQG